MDAAAPSLGFWLLCTPHGADPWGERRNIYLPTMYSIYYMPARAPCHAACGAGCPRPPLCAAAVGRRGADERGRVGGERRRAAAPSPPRRKRRPPRTRARTHAGAVRVGDAVGVRARDSAAPAPAPVRSEAGRVGDALVYFRAHDSRAPPPAPPPPRQPATPSHGPYSFGTGALAERHRGPTSVAGVGSNSRAPHPSQGAAAADRTAPPPGGFHQLTS